jgi:hypothetical protein
MRFQLFTNQGHFTAAVNGRYWPKAVTSFPGFGQI